MFLWTEELNVELVIDNEINSNNWNWTSEEEKILIKFTQNNPLLSRN